MKNIINKCLVVATVLLAAAGFAACSGKSSGPSPLAAQSERISGELGKLAEDSPMFLESAKSDYADGILSVTISFSDPSVNVADYSQALVEYVVSVWLKSHPGADLDTTLNTLSAEQGSLKITLVGVEGAETEYTIGASRLKKLLLLKPSELNFSEVKDNVCRILEKRCNSYKEAYKAAEASFELAGGFAQYTLVFESASVYANLKQNSLRGRYQKVLRDQFDVYGSCAPLVIDVVKSLGVDGYRFVYEAANDSSKTLKAALPWRIIIE